MSYPIPPGNATRPRPTLLRWFEQTDRLLRALWWVEALSPDREIPAYQITELKGALLGTIEMLEHRERQDAKRARIAQLERTEGRTPEEAELYRAKARELRGAASPDESETGR